jgi:hypothetical protein
MSLLHHPFGLLCNRLVASSTYTRLPRRLLRAPVPLLPVGQSSFYSSSTMSLFQTLKAPNGREYEQPLGLFINNEFVAAKSGETITSINPRYDEFPFAGEALADAVA